MDVKPGETLEIGKPQLVKSDDGADFVRFKIGQGFQVLHKHEHETDAGTGLTIILWRNK